MSFKQWTAVVQLVAAGIVGVWLLREVSVAGAFPDTIEDAARRLLWALGFIIAFNILASIVTAILVSIARGEEIKDERADERDKAVNAKGMRNAYLALSIGGLATLIFLGVGGNPPGAAYLLFAAMLLAGAVDSASRLAYYRLG